MFTRSFCSVSFPSSSILENAACCSRSKTRWAAQIQKSVSTLVLPPPHLGSRFLQHLNFSHGPLQAFDEALRLCPVVRRSLCNGSHLMAAVARRSSSQKRVRTWCASGNCYCSRPLAFALPAMELLGSLNHAPKLVFASQENLPSSLMED